MLKFLKDLQAMYDSIVHRPYIDDKGFTNVSFRDRHGKLRWSRHKILTQDEQREYIAGLLG